MALIEGFRVQNYRALRDVTLGRLSTQQQGEPLTPFTVAQQIGPRMNVECNQSPSFCKLRDGLRRLVA